jgi:hypothetical protein
MATESPDSWEEFAAENANAGDCETTGRLVSAVKKKDVLLVRCLLALFRYAPELACIQSCGVSKVGGHDSLSARLFLYSLALQVRKALSSGAKPDELASRWSDQVSASYLVSRCRLFDF